MQINLKHKQAACDAFMREILAHQIDIAFITEPYLRKGAIPRLPTKYKQYSYSAKATASIVINQSISHYYDYGSSNDNMCVVHVNNKHYSTTLVSLYISPSKERDLTPVENIMLKFGHSVIICTDANMHSIWAGYDKSDKRSTEFEELACTYNLICKNIPDLGIKTHCHDSGVTSSVDYTLCTIDIDEKLTNWHVDQTIQLLSDHYPILFDLNENTSNVLSRKTHNLFRTNFTKLNSHISQELELANIADITDTDNLWKTIEDTITSGVEKYAPKTKPIHLRNYWWNEDLELMRKNLKRTQRYEKHNYKQAKRDYRDKIEKSKESSYIKFITQVERENDWFKKSRILLSDKKQETHPTIKKPDGTIHSTATEAYNYLLNSNFPDTPNYLTSYQESVKRFVDHNLKQPNEDENIPAVTRTEILNAISMAPTKKAPGLDGLESILYKNTTDSLLTPLTILFNKIITTSQFPGSWKESKVAFLKKPNKTDYTNPKSYRPISLLSDASKIFERVLNARLKYHIENHKLIHELQFGFRSGIAAEQAAFKLTNDIYTGLKTTTETTAVFIDVSNAFPSVWPEGLIYKLLNNNKIPKAYTKVIHSYLTDRSATVIIDEDRKITKQLNRGVPQGSVLSPLLWNLFSNDLFNIPKAYGVKMISFADDTVLYITADPEEAERKLNIVMRLFYRWSEKWLIQFSPEKTKVMQFSRKRKQKHKPVIRLNKSVIEVVDEFKYLGIYLDSKLNWKPHLRECIKKTIPNINIYKAVCKRNFGLPPMATKMLIERVITPAFSYGALVWSPSLFKDYQHVQLNKFDRNACLAITKCYKTAGTKALLILSGLTPLKYTLEKLITSSLFNIVSNRKLMRTLEIDATLTKHEQYKTHLSPLQAAINIFERTEPLLSKTKTIMTDKFQQRTQPFETPHPSKDMSDHILILNKNAAIEKERTCQATMKLYVDASKLPDTNIGYAAIAVKNNKILSMEAGALNKLDSIFHGEIAAIKLALKMAADLEADSFAIFTDSNAAAGSLLSRNTNDRLVSETRTALAIASEQSNAQLIYIPGHCNIEYNEIADYQAKEATALEAEDLKIPKCLLTRKVKTRLVQAWEGNWTNSQDCKFTRSLFKKPNQIPPITNNKLLTYVERRVMFKAGSGHFPCRSHLHRIGKFENKHCPHCPTKIENIDHIIRECPLSTIGNISTVNTDLHLKELESIFNVDSLMKQAAIRLLKYLARESLSNVP